MSELIKYFFLDGWCEIKEVMSILDFYSLDEFQLFVIHQVFTSDLYDALEDYLVKRITDYLSIVQ